MIHNMKHMNLVPLINDNLPSRVRWVKLDLRTGSTLAIMTFDDQYEVLVNSTTLYDENDRDDIVKALENLEDDSDEQCDEQCDDNSQVSLTPAVEKAIEILDGGGYIILMTSSSAYDLADNGIMEKIHNSGVRITTIIVGYSPSPCRYIYIHCTFGCLTSH